MFDSNWECFGGNLAEKENCFEIVNQEILLDLEPCSAKYFILDRLLMHRVVLKTYGVFENKLYIRRNLVYGTGAAGWRGHGAR